jgi:UDP-glucose 4-epimerase
MTKHSLIIGGAGFIGSNLSSKLLLDGNQVTVIDNFSRGLHAYLAEHIKNDRFNFFNFDVAIRQQCNDAFENAQKISKIDEVWHLAANSDIPAGVSNPDIDLKDTFLTTFEILIQLKKYDIPVLNFASSSAIYGDFGDDEIYESIGPLLPISNYGAMKLASEAQISAACESYLSRANIFRFPNVVGIPATHGVILDFVNKLRVNKGELVVLGNGTQKKAYLHVSDLVSAMQLITTKESPQKALLVNIGPVDDGVAVKWIAERVVERINPEARIIYGEGSKGWVGDVPKFNYSTNRLKSFGWSPCLSSSESILKAIDEIAKQEGF